MIQSLNQEIASYKVAQAMTQGSIRTSNLPTAANDFRTQSKQPHHKKQNSHDMRPSATKLNQVESLKITKVFSNNYPMPRNMKNLNQVLLSDGMSQKSLQHKRSESSMDLSTFTNSIK